MTRSVNGARPVVKPEGIYLSGDAAAALSHPLRDDRSYGGDSEPIGPRIENMRIRGTPAKTTMQCNGWMEGGTNGSFHRRRQSPLSTHSRAHTYAWAAISYFRSKT